MKIRNHKTEYNYVPAPLKSAEWYTEEAQAKRAKDKREKRRILQAKKRDKIEKLAIAINNYW